MNTCRTYWKKKTRILASKEIQQGTIMLGTLFARLG